MLKSRVIKTLGLACIAVAICGYAFLWLIGTYPEAVLTKISFPIATGIVILMGNAVLVAEGMAAVREKRSIYHPKTLVGALLFAFAIVLLPLGLFGGRMLLVISCFSLLAWMVRVVRSLFWGEELV